MAELLDHDHYMLEGTWSREGERLVIGTILDPGEDDASPRVQASIGPIYTTFIHGMYEAAL